MIDTNKKSFTLVEVLISISLLGILFLFLFTTTNTTKKLNQPYVEKGKVIEKEVKIFNTFIKDFSQITNKLSIIYGKHYDMVRFQTKNSVYNIIESYVTYYVSKKNLSLIRTESLEKYDINKKEDIYTAIIYGDIMSANVKSFKVYSKDSFFNIMLRSKGLKPIVLTLNKVTQ